LGAWAVMHYYQFNIGDYVSHTRHLTPIEDVAYRRLLDAYYLSEKPFSGDCKAIARQIGMREYEQQVEEVLKEFFQPCEEGWRNVRADREIETYKGFSEAGKRGAAKRWLKGGDSLPIATPYTPPIATNNHKPITNNHKPSIERGCRLPADWKPNTEEVAYCKQTRPDLDPARVAEDFSDYWHSIPGQKGVKLDWSATWRGWVRKQFASGKKQAEETREWYETALGIDTKAKELGLPLKSADEQFTAYKSRVMKAEKGGSQETGFKTVAELWDMAQARKKA